MLSSNKVKKRSSPAEGKSNLTESLAKSCHEMFRPTQHDTKRWVEINISLIHLSINSQKRPICLSKENVSHEASRQLLTYPAYSSSDISTKARMLRDKAA